MQGKLFVFEGPDGVGKSSLATKLVEHLNQNKCVAEYMAFPGKKPGTLGDHLYKLHHNMRDFGIEAIDATSLQILHIAAHIDAIAKIIAPSLALGKTIVLDRFWWSTHVYGKVNGANFKAIEAALNAERLFWGEIRPTAVFLIKSEKPFNVQFSEDYWRKISAGYYELAENEKVAYPVFSVTNTAAQIEFALKQISETIALLDAERVASQQRHGYETDRGIKLEQHTFDLSIPQAENSPLVIRRLSPAEPTEVFDTYWKFAVERQKMFFTRMTQKFPPWTNDPIMAHYKFTNTYRASDRVSQYLIRNVIYKGDQSPNEIFFRTLLFKVFNKIETWEVLEGIFGELSLSEYSFEKYDKVLTELLSKKQTIFSAAYIMPSGVSTFGYEKKHRNYLRLIERMIAEELPRRIQESRSMRRAFELLREYPLMGDFLAYQYITDLNYSTLCNFSEMEFVIPGPGALDGIRKCFKSLGGLSETDIIHLVADRQNDEFGRLGINFQSLWGRPLQLIDCQNLFCEVDKYARIAHPDIKGVSSRTRIKQIYRSSNKQISYWYPPKWNINHLIQQNGDKT